MRFDDAVRLAARACSKLLRFKTEIVRAEKAFMRRAASDVRARMSVPAFDNSAMDGFAARSRDAESGALLRVVETIPAGRPPTKKIGRGECARIMTGSPMPSGADAVLMKEYAAESSPGLARVLRPVRRGENVRHAGEDVKKGDLLIARGAVMGPAEIGLAASQGYARIKVLRRRKVVFFTTGGEVVMPGRRLKPAQIYNANRYTLGAAITSSGCEPVYAGHLSDDAEICAAAIASVVKSCDALITCGGVSMGDFDVVKRALRKLGAKFIFERIRMKPGRPTALAVLKQKPVFTLPGNVVSTLMAYELLAGPLLGDGRPVFGGSFKARAAFSYAKDDDRRHFLRVTLLRASRAGDLPTAVCATRNQGSGVLSSMSGYNALAVIPEGRCAVKRGSVINVVARVPSLSPVGVRRK